MKSNKKEKIIFVLIILIFIFIGWRLVKSKDNRVVLHKQKIVEKSTERDSNKNYEENGASENGKHKFTQAVQSDAGSTDNTCKTGSTYNSDNTDNNDSADNADNTGDVYENAEKIFVHIDGEVNNPGLYGCVKGQRIQDAVDMAGGLTENANTMPINFSQKLTDEMKIVIPMKNKDNDSDADYSNNNIVNSSLNDYVWIENNNEIEYASSGNMISSKININTASIGELTTLPSIGEKKAKLIVEYRENVKFENIEDIMNVSGIGEKVFEAIKDFIVVE